MRRVERERERVARQRAWDAVPLGVSSLTTPVPWIVHHPVKKEGPSPDDVGAGASTYTTPSSGVSTG